MRLSECLNSSDIDTLRNIADVYRFDCSKSSKNALMQEILTHFNNRHFIAEAFSEMENECYREAVSQFMLDNRQEFSREEVLAIVRRAGSLEDGADQKGLQRLLREGFLFRLNANGGRQLYCIPEDLRKTIRDCLSDRLKQRVQVAEQQPIVYRDENLALVRDTSVFLRHIAKSEVRITKDGTIMKRKQQEILALFDIKEEVLGNVSWRFGYGRRFHDYPDRFALLYDYCYNRELIKETQDGMLLATDKAKSWLQGSEKERLEDLFRYWRLLYRRPIQKLKLCINTLSQVAKEEWVHAESLCQLLAPYVQDYYYEKAQTVIEQRICNMLVHLGLLAHGQLANGTQVLKVTALGRELLLQEEVTVEESVEPVQQMPLIIQPNFDLLVPIETYARMEWELEELTELIRVDTMRVHRLTKASVTRALQLGWTKETVLEFLCQESSNMLPGNVERMIEQWANELHRVQLYRAVLVECLDAAMANDLRTLPEVVPHVRLELTDTHFLIQEAGLAVLQDAMQKMGYQANLIG